MSSDVSHRVSLTMRLQPPRGMRRITRPMRTGKLLPHIWNTVPDLSIHYTTCMALRLKQFQLSAKTVYGPVLKRTQLSAHAQNHISLERCRMSFTTIVLGNHDFLLMASNFGNLTPLTETFCHIFTAHTHKQVFVGFRRKF